MSIDKKDVRKIARLSQIAIKEDQEAEILKDLNQIVDWVSTLSKVDTDNVDILTNVQNQQLCLSEDVVNDGGITEDVLKNSQNQLYNYFAVPKVIEE